MEDHVIVGGPWFLTSLEIFQTLNPNIFVSHLSPLSRNFTWTSEYSSRKCGFSRLCRKSWLLEVLDD